MRGVGFLVAVGILGCGTDRLSFDPAESAGGGGPSSCAPGLQVGCACDGGETGTQVCNADGSGFSPCACGSGGEGSGGEAGGGSGGAGGSGIAGGGGTGGCEPAAVQSCYSGPAGTEGIGTCEGGTQTCDATGTGFGPCVGEIVPSVDHCSTPDDEDCDLDGACAATAEWSYRLGDAGGFAYPFDAGTDASGNVFVSFFGQGVDVGAGAETGAGLLKLDASGNLEWAAIYPGTGEPGALAVGASGDVWLTGTLYSPADLGGGTMNPGSSSDPDVYLAHFDADGDHLWSQHWGRGTSAYGMDVALDDAGNVLLAGRYSGAIDFGGDDLIAGGSSGHELFVAKLDPTGAHIWSIDGSVTDFAMADSVAVDSTDDSVVITGWAAGELDFGGGTNGSTTTGLDVYVARLSTGGAPLGLEVFEAAGDQSVSALAIDSTGRVLITGEYAASFSLGGLTLPAPAPLNVYAGALGSSFGHEWSRSFANGFEQHGHAVDTDAQGQAYFVGSFSQSVNFGGAFLTSAGNLDAFVAKYDSGGSPVWAQRFGDGGVQLATAVAVDPSGVPVVAGGFSGSVTFGTTTLNALGTQDLFVAKLAP